MRHKRAVINPLYVDQDPNDVQIDRFNEAWSWEDAGWDIGELPSAWEDLQNCMGPRSALCASAPCYFGDKYCTFGKLDTVHPSRFAVPFVPTLESIQTVYWARGGDTCTQDCTSVQNFESYIRITLLPCVNRHDSLVCNEI